MGRSASVGPFDAVERRSLSGRVAIVLLALALLAAVGLRVWLISGKGKVHIDEGLAYLVAAANKGAWQRAIGDGSLVGEWRTAGELSRWVEPDGSIGLVRVARDAAEHDIHPPLYFWFLRGWTRAFGVTPRTGPMLNVLFAVAIGLATFLFARALFRDSLWGALAALFWAVGAGAVMASELARQYDLQALCTVLLALFAFRATDADEPGRGDLLGVALAIAVGMLTHYQFVLAVAGAAVFVAVRLRRAGLAAWLRLATAFAAGVMLSLALNPWAPKVIYRQQVKLAAAEVRVDRVQRLERTGHTFAAPFRPSTSLEWWRAHVDSGRAGSWAAVLAVLAAAGLVLWAVSAVPDSSRPPQGSVRAALSDVWPALFFLVWTSAAIVGMYLSLRSPPHAMGWRYLAPVQPFLAVSVVGLARALPGRSGRWAVVIVIAGLLLPVVLSEVGGARAHEVDLRPVASGRPVVVDASATWPPHLVVGLPDDASVYVASAESLMAHEGPWLDRLAGGGLYVHVGEPGPEGLALEAIEGAGGHVRELPFWPGMRGYRVDP